MQEGKYPEIERILREPDPQRIFFNSDQFRHWMARARLGERTGDPRTPYHAATALTLAQITKPQFRRHPTLGLVRAKPELLVELRSLAGHLRDSELMLWGHRVGLFLQRH